MSKTFAWLMAAIILLPLVVYIPPIQNAIIGYAVGKVNSSGNMTISYDKLRLGWPLRLTGHDVCVTTSPADTMIYVGDADIEVELLPLLALRACVRADIKDVQYNMGHPDSTICMNVVANNLLLKPSTFNIAKSQLDLSDVVLDGAKVRLVVNPSDAKTDTDSIKSSPKLHINGRQLQINNLNFVMTMRPTIDSLDVVVPLLTLDKVSGDLSEQNITANSLTVDSLVAIYLHSNTSTAATTDSTIVTTDTVASKPWTINTGKIALTATKAVYGVTGHIPTPGLDMDWLEVTGVDIRVDSFCNRGRDISVPLKHLSATERCGLHLDAAGTFSMDSAAMRAEGFTIDTYFSSIELDAVMGNGNIASDPSLPLRADINARIGLKDVTTALPSLSSVVAQLPRYRDLLVEIDVAGTVGDLGIETMSASLPGYFSVAMQGDIAGLPDINALDGHISIDGRVNDTPLLNSQIVHSVVGSAVNIPPLTLNGSIDMQGGTIAGHLRTTTHDGKLLLDGKWNGTLPSYAANVDATDFPVSAFMPNLGVGRVTATVNATGHGLDIASPRTSINADIAVAAIEYNRRMLRDINLHASIDSCRVKATADSRNTDADLRLAVNALYDAGCWNTSMDADIRTLNLQALGLSNTPLQGSMRVDGQGVFAPDKQLYDTHININNLNWTVNDLKLDTRHITVTTAINDSIVNAEINNGDFHVDAMAKCGLNSLLTKIDTATTILRDGMSARHILIDSISQTLPRFTVNMAVGRNSLPGSILKQSNIGLGNIAMALDNNSSLNGKIRATDLTLSRQDIDSVALDLAQHGDTLHLIAGMYNRPGTLDKFATVRANTVITPDDVSLMLSQADIAGRTGYRIGINVATVDSLIRLSLAPENPIINYRTWTLNKGNYIAYDTGSRLIDADLRLSEGDSYLQLLTHRLPGDTTGVNEELLLQAANIQLADWVSMSPFAPPLRGLLGSDINIRYNPIDKSLSGHGQVTLDDLKYGRQRVGSLALDLDLMTNVAKVVHATIGMSVDSTRVLTASGALNDSTQPSPMTLSVDLNRFPLAVVNPFMPPATTSLSGWLSGDMKATGSLSAMRLDGYLHFDSASVNVGMLGTDFDLSGAPIRVDSSVVVLDNFAIEGANDNPLTVNGTVDINSFANPHIDLKLAAKDMQIIKSARKRNQQVYGKAFIDLDATVRGDMRLLGVNATLDLLSGSNFTYVLGGTTTSLPSIVGASDAVKFVQFSDTASVVDADSIANTGMALMLNARLNIQNGTTINVDLSATNAQDRAQIEGDGSLTFSMSPFSDMRLTGRYNINSGYARYTPPLMSQKDFRFQRGSYVAFNGNILNPTLNIHAIDQIRANVTEEGQNSRLVNFDVVLSVTNTLDDMNVAFDLTTDDDITVRNELQSMSADQRANQAMNMLLYNVYTGPGTRGQGNLAGNPLFSFLASTINSWAANNIKGVELTFGVDQYDRTYNGNTSTATSYNYQISKSFIDDRLKVVVGGNYTDDAGSGTTTQDYKTSLINDISVEYMLNKSGTMYVKLFRHTGFESILEGEVTQTGVGFVYRRKLGSLYSLLPKFLRPYRWRHPDKPIDTQTIMNNAVQATEQKQQKQ